MAAAGWRLSVSWLVVLAALSVAGTSGSEDVVWPAGASAMELWDMLDELEPAIAGNALRVSDLAIQMVNMGDKRFANPVRYAKDNGYTECKCRLACLASGKCLAFEFTTGGRCKRFTNRGTTIEDAPPNHNMQFKMLNAGVGDACRIDLECSRQTVNATCETDVTASDNSTICQCPADYVPHNGACVDPMSLTTTVPTTTAAPNITEPATENTESATEPAAATTTVSIITTTMVTQAPVTAGSVTLQDMMMEAEFPCDEANTDTEPEACAFMGDFGSGSAPAMWKMTTKGECDLARGRCKFPAVLSTAEAAADTGAPRIEAWRSAGQFLFRIEADFETPPADLTEAYDPGSSEPSEAWKYDCSTTDGTSTVLTGILGLSRDDKFNKNIPRDMDLVLCTRFTEVFLQVDPSVGEAIAISNNGEFRCPPNHVVTGVWDSEKDFQQPKLAKCSKLVTGSVNVDDPNCVMTGRHAASDTAIYWNACVQDGGPSVVTGLLLSDVTVNAESKEWDLRCCPVTGPATSTSVA